MLGWLGNKLWEVSGKVKAMQDERGQEIKEASQTALDRDHIQWFFHDRV